MQGKVGMDPDLYLAEALAMALHRPMIFLSSLERHKDKPIFSFNTESDKPPLIYGIYIVFLCYLGGIYTVLRKAKVLYHKLFTFLVCASLIRKLLYFYNPSQSFSVYNVTSVK